MKKIIVINNLLLVSYMLIAVNFKINTLSPKQTEKYAFQRAELFRIKWK